LQERIGKDQLTHMLRTGHHLGNNGYNHYWWNSWK